MTQQVTTRLVLKTSEFRGDCKGNLLPPSAFNPDCVDEPPSHYDYQVNMGAVVATSTLLGLCVLVTVVHRLVYVRPSFGWLSRRRRRGAAINSVPMQLRMARRPAPHAEATSDTPAALEMAMLDEWLRRTAKQERREEQRVLALRRQRRASSAGRATMGDSVLSDSEEGGARRIGAAARRAWAAVGRVSTAQFAWRRRDNDGLPH